jgi:hypothetical protein
MSDPPNNNNADAGASGLALALPAAMVAQTFTAAMMFAPAVLAPVASVDVGMPATAVGVVTALTTWLLPWRHLPRVRACRALAQCV